MLPRQGSDHKARCLELDQIRKRFAEAQGAIVALRAAAAPPAPPPRPVAFTTVRTRPGFKVLEFVSPKLAQSRSLVSPMPRNSGPEAPSTAGRDLKVRRGQQPHALSGGMQRCAGKWLHGVSFRYTLTLNPEPAPDSNVAGVDRGLLLLLLLLEIRSRRFQAD